MFPLMEGGLAVFATDPASGALTLQQVNPAKSSLLSKCGNANYYTNALYY